MTEPSALGVCLAALLLSGVPAGATPTFANAITNGTVDIPGLTEASGIAASRNNADVLWTHNDSGHPAQVFALDTQGRLLGTYALPGNTDNEDIAIGPGPVTNVLYLHVADIGDNAATRSTIRIYQIPEPAVYARQYTNPVTAAMKGARTITLTYPDGPRDAEALFVDPVTGDLFIASKESTSRIYTAGKSQLDTNDSFTLTFARTLGFSVPSAADISPAGNEIIIRRENFADLWLRTNGQSISDALGSTAISIPVTGTANGEPNGEAIGFDALGSGYFTVSDNASVQPLRYFARTSIDGPRPTARPLVSAGSSWKYLDDGSNQGSAWRNPTSNDASWSTGTAQFGYGDGDEQTLVSFGANSNNRHVTTYFRKTFVADNAADITDLMLKLVVDDGAAVFLNGTPVVYEHLSAGAAYNTLATPMPVALQSTWHTYSVALGLLVEGSNTVAVEVHQSSVTGSNISFDLQLQAAVRNTAYEPFNYPAGTPLVLVTNAGGQWWTAAGSGNSPATVAGGSLAVPGLSPPFGGSLQFGAVDGPSARFNLISNVTSGTLYFSLALKLTDLGALSPAGGWLAGFNNSRGTQAGTPTVLGTRILVRATGTGGFNLGVAKHTTTAADWVWAPNSLSANQIIFLAGSYTFNPNSSSDDVAMLWVNPGSSGFGSDQPPPASLVATNGPDITADQIASFVLLQRGLNNTNQPGTILVDELRIGTTWASVTPPGAISPALGIAQLGGNIILSWQTNASGFVLEAVPALTATSVWTQVSAPAYVVNDHFAVTNAAVTGTNSSSFYRLRKSP